MNNWYKIVTCNNDRGSYSDDKIWIEEVDIGPRLGAEDFPGRLARLVIFNKHLLLRLREISDHLFYSTYHKISLLKYPHPWVPRWSQMTIITRSRADFLSFALFHCLLQKPSRLLLFLAWWMLWPTQLYLALSPCRYHWPPTESGLARLAHV